MHHFIYTSQNTFISNRTDFITQNFGLNEILHIGTSNILTETVNPTTNYVYSGSIFNQYVVYFTGNFTGSIGGSIFFASGSISGSNLVFSASYFSGSVDGIPIFTSGSISGSLVTGSLNGSLIIINNPIGSFIGQLTGSSGYLYGTGSGIDTQNIQGSTDEVVQYIDRSLLMFDITTISSSISNGTIVNPSFYLKIKVSKEYDLPITYNIYALPISQSWNMGDGYLSDGGSSYGASWIYRDNSSGSQWYTQSISPPRPPIDFIDNISYATASFGYGGGTWYTTSYCSQSFNYQSADINMNVTPIIMGWISGSFPNQGIILIQSDELQSTGSGFMLNYFGRNTNTIYSPYLDVSWDDSVYYTGSISTSSVQISFVNSGITASIQSGSLFNIIGGISGSFTGSSIFTPFNNFITASTASVSNLSVQLFTGSFSGSFLGTASYVNGIISGSTSIFYVDYFTGSINGINSQTSASNISGSISGTITGSAMTSTYLGYFSGSITSSIISLTGNIVLGYYLDTVFFAFGGGFLSCDGTGGNIENTPVFGNINGLITIGSSLQRLPQDMITLYATTPNESPYSIGFAITNANSPYNAFFDMFYQWAGEGWSSELPILPEYPFTASCGPIYNVQTMIGTFTNGPYSGSYFVAFVSNFQVVFGSLSGSFSTSSFLGENIYIPIPSGIDPYAYANINGTYISGSALGIYNILNSTSASFNGQFTNGELMGGYVNLQLSGSVYTSSFYYTSSVSLTSSILNSLDIGRPFSINVQNVQPEYKSGDIIKIDIFGRKKFPLKYFEKSTQQKQYLIPEYLPTSSFYGLKDNQTDEIVLNFDQSTKISCEYPNGNYFILDTTSFPQERYYNIIIQVQSGSQTYTIDTGKTFKITR